MHQRIPLTSYTNNKLLYISKTDISDDFKASFHSHPNLEILLFIAGEGKILTTHKTIPIRKNDLVIINTNSNHCEVSSSNCQFLALGVNQLNAYLKDAYNKKILYLSLTDDEFAKVKALYEIIFSEAEAKSEPNIIESTYESLLTLIQRNSNLFFASTAKENYSSLVSNAKNIIDNYYYSNLSINSLAHRLSISSSLLCHRFKEETKMSIVKYKLKCQIEEACNLLRITDMSILDISSATGFNNSAYFSKVFKTFVGISPKKYRLEKIKQ